jgi:hypothetical protein
MALVVATTMASSVAAKGLACTALPVVQHSQPTPSLAASKMSRKTAHVVCAASSPVREEKKDWIKSGAVALGAAAMVLLSNGASNLALADDSASEFQTYYGTAASASSYGGYGGNANKKDSAEYIFDVPQVLVSSASFEISISVERLQIARWSFISERM